MTESTVCNRIQPQIQTIFLLRTALDMQKELHIIKGQLTKHLHGELNCPLKSRHYLILHWTLKVV